MNFALIFILWIASVLVITALLFVWYVRVLDKKEKEVIKSHSTLTVGELIDILNRLDKSKKISYLDTTNDNLMPFSILKDEDDDYSFCPVECEDDYDFEVVHKG